jgi:hypothetical protein
MRLSPLDDNLNLTTSARTGSDLLKKITFLAVCLAASSNLLRQTISCRHSSLHFWCVRATASSFLKTSPDLQVFLEALQQLLFKGRSLGT